MLVVASLPFNVFMAYAMFTPVLVLYTPQQHRCSLDPALLHSEGEWSLEDLVNWTIPREEDGSLGKCFMFNLTEVSTPISIPSCLEIFLEKQSRVALVGPNPS